MRPTRVVPCTASFQRVITHIKLLPCIPTETNSTTLNLEIQPQLVLHFLTFKESHACPPDLLP